MPNKPTITITGYVAKKPEMRYSKNGHAVLRFVIPYNNWSSKEKEGYKPAHNGNGFVATSWQNFVVLGDKAEQVNEWLDKGQFVRVECSYDGKAEDGTDRPKIWQGKSSYNYFAFDVSLADSEQYSQEQEPADFVEESEIPF